MPYLQSFELEDFFGQYEHRTDLVNLASSDAMPWTLNDLRTNVAGLNESLEAAVLKYPDVNDHLIPSLRAYYSYPPRSEFLPTSGGAEALFLAMQALRCQFSCELSVGIPRPGYGAYDGIAALLDCRAQHYTYASERRWELDPEQLLECSDSCNVIIVNNPHNPTGSVAEPQLLDDVAENLNQKRGLLIVDEVFLLPEETRSCVGSAPNVLVIGSLSKVYGLPGLRLGWAVGPRALIDRMRTVQQYLSLSINWFAAAIGSAVLEVPSTVSRHQLLVDNRTTVQRWAQVNHDVVWTTRPSEGTTVVFCPARPREGMFESLLNRGLLVVPGQKCFGYGDNTWFRLGYGGVSQADLNAGLDALASVVRAS